MINGNDSWWWWLVMVQWWLMVVMMKTRIIIISSTLMDRFLTAPIKSVLNALKLTKYQDAVVQQPDLEASFRGWHPRFQRKKHKNYEGWPNSSSRNWASTRKGCWTWMDGWIHRSHVLREKLGEGAILKWNIYDDFNHKIKSTVTPGRWVMWISPTWCGSSFSDLHYPTTRP